jgi:uncharacterized protein YdaU (DUF1376 family)
MSSPEVFVKSPAFQIYPADFLADKNTLVMSTVEIGAYWLLLLVCWQENGLPEDVDELAAIARLAKAQFIKSWEAKIKRCFVQREDGHWTHKRLERERSKQDDWRRKCAKGGRASAHKRKHPRQISAQQGITAKGVRVAPLKANTSFSSSFMSSSSISSSSSDPPSGDIRGRLRADVRGTRLGDDFCLTPEMREWARIHTPSVHLESALAEFIDYWRGVPGSRGCKSDWVATWRNRMREVQGRAWKGNGRSKVDNSLDAVNRVIAEVEARGEH